MDNKYCEHCRTALIKCSECDGSGKSGGMRCTKCLGTGYLCQVHGGKWKETSSQSVHARRTEEKFWTVVDRQQAAAQELVRLAGHSKRPRGFALFGWSSPKRRRFESLSKQIEELDEELADSRRAYLFALEGKLSASDHLELVSAGDEHIWSTLKRAAAAVETCPPFQLDRFALERKISRPASNEAELEFLKRHR